MKKVFSIIAIGAMTLSLSSYSNMNKSIVLDDGDPLECNNQARFATMHFAHFVLAKKLREAVNTMTYMLHIIMQFMKVALKSN